MPDKLKDGLEQLSGVDLSDVRVHYNSPRPAQFQASGCTQGNDIYLAAGQEQHLPHEGWHVVQQRYGQVKPTMQVKGISFNHDLSLEQEADVMGTKVSRMPASSLAEVATSKFTERNLYSSKSGKVKPTIIGLSKKARHT